MTCVCNALLLPCLRITHACLLRLMPFVRAGPGQGVVHAWGGSKPSWLPRVHLMAGVPVSGA